ncbi:hypothetical protein, partial [Nonomuraea lactucae]|uniref:hypothetical protein n=1 Tax=Nonomuraea lactucae TaxID=2249762 RepID=UPI0019664C30
MNHEQGDDRPPSAFRRAVPAAPFPVFEPEPPRGMDRTTMAVLLIVGSAVVLGAWLGLHRPGAEGRLEAASSSAAGSAGDGARAGAAGSAYDAAGPG